MQSFEIDLGGKMAKQANGAVLVRYGDTVVLVTATASKAPREGVDFFPLTVDYEEKMYAAGKIPGGFIKREGRPSSDAVLCARLIDRPIRPLFPDGFRNDVQIVATVLSVEQDNPPEIAAMFGASCALTVSDIPFMGPIAGVRVGYINGKFVINPTEEQRADSDLNLTVAGSYDAVMMVEAGANELSEEIVLDAILFGHAEIRLSSSRTYNRPVGKRNRFLRYSKYPKNWKKKCAPMQKPVSILQHETAINFPVMQIFLPSRKRP